MLTKKMVKSLNEQMNKEFYSAYLYLAMSGQSASSGLKGAANWFYVQYQEEMLHFKKFFDYIINQGSAVCLCEVKAPPASFTGLQGMFEATLKHEQFVTKSINNLVDVARQEKDHATEAFLNWFVTEQVEEEANDKDILSRLKMIGKDGNGLYLLDAELAKRTFNPAAASSTAI
jgi:ferritin